MSYIRFNLNLAVKEPIPDALKKKLPEIRNAIKMLKSYASKINEGKVNEEMTVKAVWHRCHHDTNEPCEEEKEI